MFISIFANLKNSVEVVKPLTTSEVKAYTLESGIPTQQIADVVNEVLGTKLTENKSKISVAKGEQAIITRCINNVVSFCLVVGK